ncbi:ChaN family lipoprotein [Halodurantibacterium flavum]|uniref:ChaN family lipoprotein n=1 Tax=Halodurantibacterium flavum TaxID=1382802 RepID=A0ABW4S8G5_9RHOB
MRLIVLATLAAAPCVAQCAEIGAEGLSALPRADVVVVGEVHDNPAHHMNQKAVLDTMRPAAVVFEMLTPDQAARVTPDLRADCKALAEALDWESSGWPDFAMYCPLFQVGGAVHGAAIPRDEARRAMTGGAEAVFGPEAARYGLDQPLAAADQTTREAEFAEAHCNALPPDLLPGMVTAQRVRDARLAQVAIRAHGETGGPVAVIAGTGHARRDRGIPAKLALAAPDLSVIALGQLETPPDGVPPFDYWIVTSAPDRGDPCAAFR